MTGGEFENILLPCYKRMYATAFGILRNQDDASDAVQDAISALWQKHPSLPVPENPQAFCSRTVRNVCIDRLRINRERYFDNIDSLWTMAMADDSATDKEISFASTSAYIINAMSALNEKHRRVLGLSIFSQLTTEEICSVTGESAVNVRMILSRGRKKLKELLKHER